MKTDIQNKNDNLPNGIIQCSLSRDAIEAELRTKVERWLRRGVPPERLGDILFGLSKDLAHYAVEHDPVDRDRALERYNQASEQLGVMMIIRDAFCKDYVDTICSELDEADDEA